MRECVAPLKSFIDENALKVNVSQQGDKYLVLKKKYRQPFLDFSPPQPVESPLASPDIVTPVSPLREPPPYRPPPPAPLSPSSNNSHSNLEEATTPISEYENCQKNDNSDNASGASVSSPPVPPRRKSQDKLKTENKENDRNKNGLSEAVIKVRFLFIQQSLHRHYYRWYSHNAVDDDYYFLSIYNLCNLYKHWDNMYNMY